METTQTANTYRDASFSRATRDKLAELIDFVSILPSHREALTDVVQRWDANDAAEFTVAGDDAKPSVPYAVGSISGDPFADKRPQLAADIGHACVDGCDPGDCGCTT